MNVEIVPVLGDNYAYLVACEETGQAAAVDPAGAEEVARRAEALGLQLTAVWTTHHHEDHAMGNAALARRFEGLKVYGHESERDSIPALTDAVTHGASLQLGALRVEVLHTPGHTRGSCCYRVEDALFCGDTLFAAGCGRLFEGDPPTMFRSLHEVVGALPDETRVFCGHEYTEKNLDFAWSVEPGNQALKQRIDAVQELRARGEPSVPFTLADERASSPFFRCDSPEIQASLACRFPDDPPQTPLAVFTRLRELRNSY
jgi:hydroxyacylglutathione hydrolase